MRRPGYLRNLPSTEVLYGARCSPATAKLFEPVTRTGSEGCEDASIEDARQRQRRAMDICYDCPVKQLCYEDAVMNLRIGVYGGVAMDAAFHKNIRKSA